MSNQSIQSEVPPPDQNNQSNTDRDDDDNSSTNTNHDVNLSQTQTDFMQSMTNAILRFIDKNGDCTKSDAERSVFEALGYDASNEQTSSSSTSSSSSPFLSDLNYFRRHHIMRQRDAIRTIRIKQMHNNVVSTFPNYTPDQVLTHLTRQLDELYVPSPPPPAPLVQNKLTHATNSCQNIERKEIAEHTSIECIISATTSKAKEDNKQTDIISNYTINHDDEQHIKEKKKQNNEKRNNCVKKIKSTKSKKNGSNKRCIQSKHGLGYKQNVFASNIFVYPQQKLPSPARASTTANSATSNPYFVCDDDVELAKKLSMHQQTTQQHKKPKSRKRKKFGSMERDGFEFDNHAPSKKRVRMNAFGAGRGRGRMRKKNQKFHRGKNKERMSENEEEEDSEIDGRNTTNNSVSNIV